VYDYDSGSITGLRSDFGLVAFKILYSSDAQSGLSNHTANREMLTKEMWNLREAPVKWDF